MLLPFVLILIIILAIDLFTSFKLKSLNFSNCIVSFISLLLITYFLISLGEEKKPIQQLISEKSSKIKLASNQVSEVLNVTGQIKNKVLLDVPIINQFPESPRDCEVTSLAMLLQYKGIQIDKMELAKGIKKDSTPLKRENGSLYWGSPNNGFIGDMYSYSNPGYGVYHKPIKELAEQFLPGEIINLTGKDFIALEIFLSKDIPIWIIINTTYKKLPDTLFETWQTPEGEMKITYKEHSVLVTGYDDQIIYFNDPLNGEKNRAANRQDFIDAWQQMGSQAITYRPN